MPSASPALPEVVTLGCRLNIAESETIRTLLGGRDTVVVNSCAVTNEAVAATRRAIRRARRARPEAELVVTGCAAQIDPHAFAGMAEVDRVVGNADKLRAESWSTAAPLTLSSWSDVAVQAPHLVHAFDGHARAFVEVQNGCDHRCTFCAIPAGRGPSRSVAAGALADHVAALVACGHREVVLTGVDLTSYAAPDAPTLALLVERLLAVRGLDRLRLSSLDPMEVDDRLLALLTGEARIMPHVHLSFQAGDDLVLKRMRRRHLRRDAVALVERLKRARPAIAIGADLIAGFPTESDAAAANTLALLDDADVVHAHVFPYSPRAGTPAARMPQVPPAIVRTRAAGLRARAAERHAAWLARHIGTRQRVLVERPGERGHGEDFASVRWAGARETGSIVDVTITGVDAGHLVGVPA